MKEADFFRSRSSDGRKMRFRAFPAVEMLKTFNYEAPKTLRPGSKLMLLPPLGGPAVNYSVGLTLMPMVYTSLHPVPWGGGFLTQICIVVCPNFLAWSRISPSKRYPKYRRKGYSITEKLD